MYSMLHLGLLALALCRARASTKFVCSCHWLNFLANELHHPGPFELEILLSRFTLLSHTSMLRLAPFPPCHSASATILVEWRIWWNWLLIENNVTLNHALDHVTKPSNQPTITFNIHTCDLFWQKGYTSVTKSLGRSWENCRKHHLAVINFYQFIVFDFAHIAGCVFYNILTAHSQFWPLS